MSKLNRNFSAMPQRAPRLLYFLNDYYPLEPRLRIQEYHGGKRCVWKERTTLKKMEETKLYLESIWHA